MRAEAEAEAEAPSAEAGKDWRPGVVKTLAGLREYLLLPGEPDTRLNPKWLARRLGVPVRELLGALAYAVRDGLVEMSWEVYCPVCGRSPLEFGTLEEAHGQIECAACESCFDLHLDPGAEFVDILSAAPVECPSHHKATACLFNFSPRPSAALRRS